MPSGNLTSLGPILPYHFCQAHSATTAAGGRGCCRSSSCTDPDSVPPCPWPLELHLKRTRNGYVRNAPFQLPWAAQKFMAALYLTSLWRWWIKKKKTSETYSVQSFIPNVGMATWARWNRRNDVRTGLIFSTLCMGMGQNDQASKKKG